VSDIPGAVGTDTAAAPDYVGLAWRFGVLSVQRRGAMLGPLTFLIDGDRQVSPLYLAPWAASDARPPLSDMLKSLRGEWPCVPFGSWRAADGFAPAWAGLIGSEQDERYQHGFGSHAEWTWRTVTPSEIELVCHYPDDNDIEELTRRVKPVPDRAAVDLELVVKARRRTSLPAGLHFTFCAPRNPATLRPGAYREAWTYPGPPFERLQALAPDRRFQDLARAPAKGGGIIDATTFPPTVPAEDVIQLNGVDGRFALDLPADDCRVSIEWNAQHFPSVMLWLSNRGLEASPWNAQHVALGIEPVCSAFGLGLAVARAHNPLRRAGTPTVIDFDPATPFKTRYRISAMPLTRPS
jgi:hypothetical protein